MGKYNYFNKLMEYFENCHIQNTNIFHTNFAKSTFERIPISRVTEINIDLRKEIIEHIDVQNSFLKYNKQNAEEQDKHYIHVEKYSSSKTIDIDLVADILEFVK